MLKSNKIFISLLIIDVLFLLLHLIIPKEFHFFNLDNEDNYPVVYQSLKCFLAGNASLIVIFILKKSEKLNRENLFFWFGMTIFFTLLGIDDLLQLHEQITSILSNSFTEFFSFFHAFGFKSSKWIIVYSPLILVTFYFLFKAYSYTKKSCGKRNQTIFFIGFALLLSVPFWEYISSPDLIVGGRNSLYFVFVGIEEASEMIGVSLIVTFIFNYLYKLIFLNNDADHFKQKNS